MLNHYPDVLTVEQAAHILCVSEKSLYRLLRDGTIGCKRIGRKYLIPRTKRQSSKGGNSLNTFQMIHEWIGMGTKCTQYSLLHRG
jgi:excisionase family DNA binding protein